MTALKSKDEERRKKVPSKLHCFQKIDKDGVGDQKAAGREGIKAAGKMGEAVGFTIPENAPRGFRQCIRGDAAGRAEREHDALGLPLTRRGRGALGIDGVSRKVGVEIAREREALAAEVTVRAGAEAEVFRERPVTAVVAGRPSRAAEVGDLILLIALPREKPDRGEVHIRLRVVVRQREALAPRKERRALLDLQPVAGKMLGRERERGVKVCLPARHRLLGQTVDEVETQIVKARGAGVLHRADGLRVRVDAPDAPQLRVVRGLHPEREAVEACIVQLPQGGNILRAVGVGLERDLRAGGDAVALKNRVQKAAQAVGAEIARCAAAEVNGVYGAVRRALPPRGELRGQRGDVSVHLSLGARQGVEVAVNALRLAERNVDVKPK